MEPNRQLESWKEIAGFFHRDERTVKRWEKERGLPVHRYPGTKGRVFAFTDELSAWLAGPRSDAAPPAPPTPQTPPGRPLTNRSFLSWTALLAAVAVVALAFGLGWIGPHAGTHGTTVRTANPEAEALYLKGRFFWNQRTPDGLNKALDYFTQATAKDPSYAEAYVGLADTYNLLREYTPMPSAEAYRKALAAANKAVTLDESLADGHRALAFALFYGNLDIPSAEREFQRAIQLNPGVAVTHHWYATCLMTLTRFQESLDQIQLAQRLDPTSQSILSDEALVLWHLGRSDQAVSQLKQVEAADPNFVSPHRYLSYIYLVDKNYRDYLAELKQAAMLAHDENRLQVAVSAGKALAAGGPQAMLEDILQCRKELHSRGLESPFQVASAYSLLGKKREALAYLKMGWEEHDPSMLYVRLEPAFSSLKDEPEYHHLLEQIGVQ